MWPFGSRYPERRPEEVDGKTFDYIIVGGELISTASVLWRIPTCEPRLNKRRSVGGCAGCVLASRLSEDANTSVLVLEKGHVKDNWLSRVPLLSQNFVFPYLQVISRLSQPIAEAGGRKARLWTAEAVGGASRINGMLLTRGIPGGFAEWARDMGLTDWSWEKVEPYFKKSENAVGHPDAPYRGHDGPVENCQPPSWLSCYPYHEKAAKAAGLPVHQDLNDPNAPAQGYFYLDMTIDKNAQRLSSYRAWLNRHVANARRDLSLIHI